MLVRPSARFGAALLLTVVLAGCSRQASAPTAAKPIPVSVQAVTTQAWNSTVQSIATVRARESVALTAAVSDVVEQVYFDSGDEVKAGQLLLRLRGNAQQAALTAAQATFEETDQLYRRQLSLVGLQLVAKSTVDTQRALRDAAQARVQQMRAEINDREVRAPFSGVLGIRQISPGSLITSSTVIATLDDVERMYVDFQVPESQLGLVQLGNAVSGSAAAYPGAQFDGKVAAIDSRIEQTTRSVTVRADFPNGDRRLRPGMLLDVRLFQPARQAVVIPEIAVVQVGRESYVFRVKPDSSVERADVRLGERRAGKVEILEGLSAGERIVVDGTGKLRPGVKVVDRAAPAAARPQAAR
ncbi:efflux RND transporter periplasmic adaptor subunit [Xanthomonas fragariae]|uniref:Efflux pump periplasmic linker BepF n=1 Tax=Xanthomonas fragariae TaxID=48664 RepID=A0A1Y6GWU3_9XANT|nr:efflux RND transporter periplasmic adaptor subunit [Xanthomonas fragariae]AOD16027.1 efflux transporter periplasmic adaptor subunit [Xanthomonas fragariae]AOD19454.1 efflux transporter periplasmic adaptor subunit [Xanthomonas fragariae]ENZ96943.1 RND efflux membrane fusion protein [Xanthomonas fragariae LMG 25863]MBL9197330.1 efflux RND transporter periplasmic adaptor subunit [Xanthomonas fragariae]MBL9222278.1 efflux RND transporter periplasmic adaptor subunit [Xanthomonas fragariae]